MGRILLSGANDVRPDLQLAARIFGEAQLVDTPIDYWNSIHVRVGGLA